MKTPKPVRFQPVCFPITSTIRVRKNDTGLDYLLIPKHEGYFITPANCYGVDGGQMMFWSDKEIDETFQQVIA